MAGDPDFHGRQVAKASQSQLFLFEAGYGFFLSWSEDETLPPEGKSQGVVKPPWPILFEQNERMGFCSTGVVVPCLKRHGAVEKSSMRYTLLGEGRKPLNDLNPPSWQAGKDG